MAYRLLLVDDDPDICALVKRIFERRGYTVDYAYHGREAWRKLTAAKPDVLLLDLGLPEINGWKLAQRIRNENSLKDLPIIVLSARKGLLDRAQGGLYGVAAYLTKPFHPATLREQVDQVLTAAGRQPLSAPAR